MKRSISLPEEQDSFIKDQVASGQYSTASEVVRDAIRLLQEKEAIRQQKLEALRAEIEKGKKSIEEGRYDTAENVFKRFEKKIEEAKLKQ